MADARRARGSAPRACSPTSATRSRPRCCRACSPRPSARRPPRSGSSRGSATGSPGSPASPVAPWPTTPIAGAAWPSAATPPPRSWPRAPVRRRRCGRSALLRAGAWAARGLRVPARNALLADVVPASRLRAGVRVRAGDGQPRRDRRPAARHRPRRHGRDPLGDRPVRDPGAAGRRRDHLRDPPHPRAARAASAVPIRLQVRPVLRGGLGPAVRRGRARSRSATAPPRCSSCAPPSCSNPATARTRRRPIALALYVAYNAGRHRSPASPPAGLRSTARRRSASSSSASLPSRSPTSASPATRPAWWALLPWFVAAGIGIGCVETAEHAAVAGAAPDRPPRLGVRAARRACRASATSPPAPSPACCGPRSARPGRSPTSPPGCSSRSCSSASPGRPP